MAGNDQRKWVNGAIITALRNVPEGRKVSQNKQHHAA